jgi:HSP20 family protein
VRGERSFETEGKEENFHRVERRYGSFYRAFTVPNTIDPESIKLNMMPGFCVWNCRSVRKASPSRSR